MGESGIPQRRARAYSFSPGRQDSIRANKLRKRASVQAREPVPNMDIAQRMPTLYHDKSTNKRRGQPLPRKKSSKRRKEDHDREAEIKAMSQFMPTRPATDDWTAGRPMKRESRQSRLTSSRAGDQPSSDISLPLADSLHSRFSSDSEQISWKVSAFDALSPRPTLRYSSNPIMGSAPGSGLVRSQSRRKTTGPITIPESILHAHRRIHDLADELDASDLRELMERDKRRRERKIQKDQERAERRLARRAEKQQAEEAAAVKSGTPPPVNLERGVLGREMPDSGGNRTSAVFTSSKRRSSSDSRRQSRQSSQIEEPENRRKTPSPLNEFYRTDSIPRPEPSSPLAEVSEAATPLERRESLPARSPSPRLFGFIRSRKSRSKSPRQSEQTNRPAVRSPPTASIKFDDGESVSRTSESRSARHWLSLFKWAKNRHVSGPSSFSNTSRDSMQGSLPTQPTSYVPRTVSAGMPKRTMSRFREDLPELPISPPDSRVASPEADPLPVEPLPAIPDDVAMRYDTPVEGQRSQEAKRATPISINRDEVQPSPALHSMSLASIDSEASWLSGRISRKRASSGLPTSLQYPPRTVSALSGRSEAQASERTEDDNIADDEYLNSVVPAGLHRVSTGEARPSSDEEDDSSPKWGAVGQTPTVVQHSDTMRSREGILQTFDDDKDSGSVNENEDDDEDAQSPGIPQRAKSVNLSSGHVRNISAGTAKLLEVSPRPSHDHQRISMEHNAQ